MINSFFLKIYKIKKHICAYVICFFFLHWFTMVSFLFSFSLIFKYKMLLLINKTMTLIQIKTQFLCCQATLSITCQLCKDMKRNMQQEAPNDSSLLMEVNASQKTVRNCLKSTLNIIKSPSCLIFCRASFFIFQWVGVAFCCTLGRCFLYKSW